MAVQWVNYMATHGCQRQVPRAPVVEWRQAAWPQTRSACGFGVCPRRCPGSLWVAGRECTLSFPPCQGMGSSSFTSTMVCCLTWQEPKRQAVASCQGVKGEMDGHHCTPPWCTAGGWGGLVVPSHCGGGQRGWWELPCLAQWLRDKEDGQWVWVGKEGVHKLAASLWPAGWGKEGGCNLLASLWPRAAIA